MTSKVSKRTPKNKKVDEEFEDIEEDVEEEHAEHDPEAEEIEKLLPSKKRPAPRSKNIDDPEDWARIEEERVTWD